MMPSIARAAGVRAALLASAPAAQAPLPPTLGEEAQALLHLRIPVALVLGPGLQEALDARATQARAAVPGGDRRAVLSALAARWSGRVDVFDDGRVITLRDGTPSCQAQLERTLDTDRQGAADRAADDRTLAVVPVSFGGGVVSLQAALNELVAKAGRLGWAIGSERDPERGEVCRIALLTRSTTLVTFHEIPPR